MKLVSPLRHSYILGCHKWDLSRQMPLAGKLQKHQQTSDGCVMFVIKKRIITLKNDRVLIKLIWKFASEKPVWMTIKP